MHLRESPGAHVFRCKMTKRNPLIRVAHIKYSPQGSIYSARCDRRDIEPGNEVEVLFKGDTYQRAEVVGISFERWQCRDVVLNLVSEVRWIMNPDGTMSRSVIEPEFDKVGDAGEDMRDVYEAASSGDGGDAYLSDGLWISPDGTIKDKGR
jgi:hypothetical protein